VKASVLTSFFEQHEEDGGATAIASGFEQHEFLDVCGVCAGGFDPQQCLFEELTGCWVFVVVLMPLVPLVLHEPLAEFIVDKNCCDAPPHAPNVVFNG
jgi:hypothetical protein